MVVHKHIVIIFQERRVHMRVRFIEDGLELFPGVAEADFIGSGLMLKRQWMRGYKGFGGKIEHRMLGAV